MEKQENKEKELKSRILELEQKINLLSGSGQGLYSEGTHLEELYDSIQDIYFRCDLKGEITRLNVSVKELTGYIPEEITGRNITNYYLYNPRIKGLIKRLARDKQVRNFEASIVKNNGDILQCLCNIRIVEIGERREIEGVVRDVTEIKKINSELLYAKELAERSLKVKEKFLANMSHEIRTPLNGIIGMIDLLASTTLDQEQSEYIKTIKKSSEILLYILNDILEISKIEAGKVKLRKRAVSLIKVIDKIKDLFSQEAASKGIDFSVQVDEKIPAYLVLDETRFLQVLSNLTSNALKFTDQEGKVDIKIVHKELNGETCKMKIEVSDTGIGISPELQDSLFKSFSQLDNSLTKEYSGTGLGLAISQELCQLMGGEIQIQSEPGKGSTFWFELKAEVSKEAPEIEVDTTELEGLINISGNPLILLVDDNKINRDVAREILMKGGSRVMEASSGRRSIELVKENAFDLIIMDIQMPDMDGIEAMKLIRGNDGMLPPIIAMTAYAMKDDEDRFLKEGFDGYIAKPIRANTLIRKVSRWLDPEKEGEWESASVPVQEEEAIINQSVVESLRKIGGETLLKETYMDFVEEASDLLETIDKELTKSDYNSILSPLHTLKGNAGTLGLDRVYGFSVHIESNLKSGIYLNLERDIRLLNAAFKEFREKYKRILKIN